MKPLRALLFASPLALVAFVTGCSHSSPPPKSPPEVSTTSTTSAALSTESPAPAQDRYTIGGPYHPATDDGKVERDVPIDAWSERYPDAARGLAAWCDEHPDVASRLAAWDSKHPIRMSTLVEWSVTHKYEPIEAFLYGRSGWQDFSSLLHDEHRAMAELVDWIRRSPHAAEELATHDGSIAYARGHLGAHGAHAHQGAREAIATPASPSASASATRPAP